MCEPVCIAGFTNVHREFPDGRHPSEIVMAYKGGKELTIGRRCLLMWALLVLLPLSVAHAAEGCEKDTETGRMPIGLGIEYYAPAEDDRNIRT